MKISFVSKEATYTGKRIYWTNSDKLFENIQVRWKHRMSKGRRESVMEKNLSRRVTWDVTWLPLMP